MDDTCVIGMFLQYHVLYSDATYVEDAPDSVLCYDTSPCQSAIVAYDNYYKLYRHLCISETRHCCAQVPILVSDKISISTSCTACPSNSPLLA